MTSICFGGRNSGHHTYVYPWHSDYTIAKSDLATATRDIAFSTAPVHMMTEEEDGTPHTITLNGIAGDGGQVFIEGAGAFIVNSDCTRTGATIVTNGATLAFGPGADFGTGAMTFHAGTTLKFTDGLSTGTRGGALTLPGGDGSVALVIDGETLAEGDYLVYDSSAVLPAGVAGTFLLSGTAIPDPAEKKSTLYVSTDGKQLRLLVGNPALETDDFVWTGAAGDGKFSTPGNWLGNKDIATATAASKIYISVPSDATLDCDVAVTAGSITFPISTRGVTINGTGSLALAAVTNKSSNTVKFSAPVTFAGTYSVVKSGAVVFAGGATATYPDAAQRTSSSSDLNRTLSGKFTFTENWSIPGLGNNYDKPWILAGEGSEIRGKALTGTQTNRQRIFRVEEGASAYFTVMTNGWSIGDIDVNGYLEVEGEVVVKTYTGDGGWSNFGRSGNTGTVKAERFVKTVNGNVRSYIPNLIVGKGGLGCIENQWRWEFYANTAVKAADDFEFLGLKNSGNAADWGIRMGKNITLTIDVPEGKTVTLGCGVTSDTQGAIRKTGKGVLVMTDTFNDQSGYTKTYSGGTAIEEGTLSFVAGSMGTGSVTLGGGTTLAVPPVAGETDPLAIAGSILYGGEGPVSLKIGDGSPLDDGTYKVLAAGAAISGELVSKLSLANSASSAAFYIADGGKTLMLSVGAAPVITEFVWSGAAGDGKMNTPGNWLGGAVPGTGAEVFFASGAEGTIENDITGFAPKSITFTEGIGEGLTLSGNGISVSGAITNRSTTVSPVIAAKTLFTSGKVVVKHNGTGNGPLAYTGTTVRFAGGVTRLRILLKRLGRAVRTTRPNAYTLRPDRAWLPMSSAIPIRSIFSRAARSRRMS